MLVATGPVEDILAVKIREYQALNEQVRCCSWIAFDGDCLERA